MNVLGRQVSSIGRGLTTVVSPIRYLILPMTRNSAFLTIADFPKTRPVTLKHGGPTSPCCTSSLTGTCKAMRAKRWRFGPTATVMKWN